MRPANVGLTPEDWLALMQPHPDRPTHDDVFIAKSLLAVLEHYDFHAGSPMEKDTERVLALITAVRLHQLAQEGP